MIKAMQLAMNKGLLLLILAALSGCAAGPKPVRSEQFCDLKTVTNVNRNAQGEIIDQSSNEVLVCSDSAVERVTIKQAGIAKNCQEYTYYVTLRGQSVEQRGISCEKFNGNWEILPIHNGR
jgi:hypothetical protein